MKRILLLASFAFLINAASAQLFSGVNFLRNGNLDFMTFKLDGNVLIYLNKDGSVKKWGYDRFGARGQDNYLDELDAYIGRVDYYTANDDAAYRGKIKYIGNVLLSYYASYEQEWLRGKLKSIGKITLDYYSNFDNEAFKGSIKSIGANAITWYGSFDNSAVKGKLKSVGPTSLTYYNSSDDKLYSGRLKTIGNSSFTWYGSFDLKDYQGALKTGLQAQTINQVKYTLR